MKADYIELLAPAGTFEVLKADVTAGADAVYVGGKQFNMRMHQSNFNFDEAALKEAIKYTHDHGVKLHVTVNNLISESELPAMKEYLTFLDTIKPDALIVQDLAVISLANQLNLSIPLHASIMLNTHNVEAIKLLQSQGLSRVVVGHQLSLAELSLLQEKTNVELEYFIHGDMCLSYSGSCYHSGILFGLSSNRGRCLKPCRWPFKLTNQQTGETLSGDGPYKLALKDMCMYQCIPDLIQSGVTSFKIEGRMRSAEYISKIVAAYRKTIDHYLQDPQGYCLNHDEWNKMLDNRVRNFTTCYALGKNFSGLVDQTGKREPRLISRAISEPAITQTNLPSHHLQTSSQTEPCALSVKVKDLASVDSAFSNGADTVYISGDTFKPSCPWTVAEIKEAANIAKNHHKKLVLSTPRITKQRELSEIEELLTALKDIPLHGIMVNNLGTLNLAKRFNLPIYGDFSLNVLNHQSQTWLKTQEVVQTTLSIEAALSEIAEIIKHRALPTEVIVHGSLEAMLMDYCLPAAENSNLQNQCQSLCQTNFSLIDETGEKHLVKIDQYCRTHILFAKDLCVLPSLSTLFELGVTLFRIEGNHYDASTLGKITALYKQEIDKITMNLKSYSFDQSALEQLVSLSPNALSSGVFQHNASK